MDELEKSALLEVMRTLKQWRDESDARNAALEIEPVPSSTG